jgi:hypothetical protein
MSHNNHIVLVMGKPNTGKSTSLRNLRNQEQMVYLNTDLKNIPFKSKFCKQVEVADAMDILSYIQAIEDNEKITGAVLDTLTFLMSMYERQYVVPATNGQAAWGAYGNYYREFIHAIKSGTKDYAIFAHEDTVLNEQTMQMETKIPIKGSVGKTGAEADFSVILSSKQMPIKKLEQYQNSLLTITDDEREAEVKYVFCTRIAKEFVGEKMRAPIGLWKKEELFIDNDIQLVFDRLREYYA